MKPLLHILNSHQNQPTDMKNVGKIGFQEEELFKIFPEFPIEIHGNSSCSKCLTL